MRLYAVSAALIILAHFGVPDWCCGVHNCRYTDTALISRGETKSIVEVEGLRFEVPNERVFSVHSHFGGDGVYCWNDMDIDLRSKCSGGVSAECAYCIGVAFGTV